MNKRPRRQMVGVLQPPNRLIPRDFAYVLMQLVMDDGSRLIVVACSAGRSQPRNG